jgi:hypothetical protein
MRPIIAWSNLDALDLAEVDLDRAATDEAVLDDQTACS